MPRHRIKDARIDEVIAAKGLIASGAPVHPLGVYGLAADLKEARATIRTMESFIESVRMVRDCALPTGEQVVLALGERLTMVANALDTLDAALKEAPLAGA